MERIGIISFIPDSGHVLPLLRIGKTFATHQDEVICYLPDECLKMAEGFDLPMKSLGKITTGLDFDIFRKISTRSFFYFWHFGYKVLAKNYCNPIGKQIAAQFSNIEKMVREDHLSMIIADNHLFEEWYVRIAQLINVPIALHASEGNLRYIHNPFHHHYGFHFSKPVTIYDRLLIRPALYLRKIGSALLGNRRLTNMDGSIFESQGVIRLSSGLAPFEKEIIDYNLAIRTELYRQFPPVEDRSNIPIKNDLQEWLENSKDKPVIYVSFGTMIKPAKKVLLAIFTGLIRLNARVLWVISKEDKGFLESQGSGLDIRFEEYVPQPKILKDRHIKFFITHGGAGSIQEGLLAGKPMLCIPFAFDQPYNSSIVVFLNAGIRLDKNKVTERSISKALIELVVEPRYQESARCVSELLSGNEGGEAIFSYLKSFKSDPSNVTD